MKKGAHLKKLAVSTIVVLIVLFGLTVAAKATLITYELGGVFSAASPTSPAPWLTASFNDNGGGTTSGFVGTVPIPPSLASRFRSAGTDRHQEEVGRYC